MPKYNHTIINFMILTFVCIKITSGFAVWALTNGLLDLYYQMNKRMNENDVSRVVGHAMASVTRELIAYADETPTQKKKGQIQDKNTKSCFVASI